MSDTPSPLFRTPLPAVEFDTGVKLAASSAVWWRPEEMPIRKKRLLDTAGIKFASVIQRASQPVSASETVTPGETVTPSETVTLGETQISAADLDFVAALTDSDVSAMFEMNDILAFCYLRSWGYLDEKSEPFSLPTSPESLLDYPRALYDALEKASAKIHSLAQKGDTFSIDNIENPDSPTGPFAT